MEFLYIVLEIPSIHPPTIIILIKVIMGDIFIVRYLLVLMMMVFLVMGVLECLWLMEEVVLSINKPSTLPLAIVDFILVVIKVVTMEEVYFGIKRPAALTF